MKRYCKVAILAAQYECESSEPSSPLDQLDVTGTPSVRSIFIAAMIVVAVVSLAAIALSKPVIIQTRDNSASIPALGSS